MEIWIVDLIEQFGYFAVFLLIAVENVFPPIPSEIILTFAGFMSARSELSFIGMVLASTCGSYIGALILYGLGCTLQLQRLERYFKLFKFKLSDIEKANQRFAEKGGITVLLCRFVPVIRSLISIPAGMSRMKLLPFSLYTLLGSAVWNGVLIYIGALLKNHYGLISDYMKRYGFAAALLLLFGLIYLIRKKRAAL